MPPGHWKRSSRRTPRARWGVGAVTLALACLLVLGLIDLVSGESALDDVGVSVEDVLEDTEQYSGGSVTVSGRIRELGRGAFAVGGDEAGDQLLLLTTAHTRGSAPEGRSRIIVGTVRRFDRELFRALRRPFKAPLGAPFLEPYEGRPAVIVRSFDRPSETKR